MQSADLAASPRPKLSAFVLTYNRERIIGTCLRALAFADEVIVVDKSSTDNTRAIAAPLADRVITVPWSPLGDETRRFALSQCTHDWVLFLDDDECLNVEAVRFLDAELRAPRADFYALPLRHYIMGMHDERAYYWPEHHVRCFRRGSIEFLPTVHDTMRRLSDRGYAIPVDSGPCIHHLSHRDVAQFIEKTNRYTSQPDRRRSPETATGIAAFAHGQVDHWQRMTDACAPESYPAAVAVLRAVYDIVDRLKTWEEEAALDGDALFGEVCARLDAAYAVELCGLARPRAGLAAEAVVAAAPAGQPAAAGDTAVLSRAVTALRQGVQALRDALDRAHAETAAARAETAEARAAAAVQHARALEMETTLGDFARRHDTMFAELMADIGARETDRQAREAERAAMAAEHAAAAEGWRQAMAQLTARADAAEGRLRRIEASMAWRVAAPVRAAMRRLGRG
jgi:hypothetical protein